jgi:hypothetical protein
MPIAVIEKPRNCSTNIAQPAGSFGTEEKYSSGNTITSRRSFERRRSVLYFSGDKTDLIEKCA